MNVAPHAATAIGLGVCLCVAASAAAKPPDREGTCAAIRAEAHALVTKALKGVDFSTSPSILLEAFSPIGTCVEPVVKEGQWALVLMGEPTLETVEIFDYDADTGDGEDPPVKHTLHTVVGDWVPVFVTRDGRRIAGDEPPLRLPGFDAYLDVSGNSQVPNWPHDDRVVDVVVRATVNQDGSVTAVFANQSATVSLFRMTGDRIVQDPGQHALEAITSFHDIDKDGFEDLLDEHSLRVALTGDGRYASASFPLVALGDAEGGYAVASPSAVAEVRRNCDGLGRSPWVLGRSGEDAAVTNIACARLLGTPRATIADGLAREKALVERASDDAGLVSELLGDAYDWLIEWLGEPVPAFTKRDDGLVRLEIVRASASSSMKAFGVYAFDASQAIDGDLGTSWQPRSARAAWIELRLESPASVTAVEIANGFQRKDDLGDLFEMNSRARRIRVEAAGRTFELDVDPNLRGARRYDLPEAVMTGSVRLTVVGTARGARWDHLAISEIALLTSP